jgi:hypothetical protein
VCGPELVNKTNWVKHGKGKDIGWLSYEWGGVWWGLYGSNGVGKAIHSDVTVRQGDVNPPMTFMAGKDSVEVNEWHHICGTWDGRDLKLYVDGDLKNSAPFEENVELCTQAYIGAHYGATSQFFPGMLDNIRIWNRSLNPHAIENHSNGKVIKDDANLVFDYSAKLKSVVKTGGSKLKELNAIEGDLNLEAGDVPPAISVLMEDLKNYLIDLDKKRKG